MNARPPCRARADAALPPWTGDDDALTRWTIAERDKDDDAAFREFTEGAALYSRAVLAPILAQRSKAESRKRHLTIGRRADTKHRQLLEARAIEEGDVEALRRLHPQLAQYINRPREPGRPRNKIDQYDPLSPEARLAEALHDQRRILELWKEKFGLRNRPTGAVSAAKIAAERAGLDEDDVLKRRVSAATRERLASR